MSDLRKAVETVPLAVFLSLLCMSVWGGLSCAPVRVKAPKKPAPAEIAEGLLERIKENFSRTQNFNELIKAVEEELCTRYPGERACADGRIFCVEQMYLKGEFRLLLKYGWHLLTDVEHYPYTQRIKYFITLVYIRMGRVEKAVQMLYQIHPEELKEAEREHLSFLKAEVSFMNSDFDDVVNVCLNLMKNRSHYSGACMRLMDASLPYVQNRNLIEKNEKILKKVPSFLLYEFALAQEYAASGSTEKAIRLLKNMDLDGNPYLKGKVDEIIKNLKSASHSPEGDALGVMVPLSGAGREKGLNILRSVIFAYKRIPFKREILIEVEDTSYKNTPQTFFSLCRRKKPSAIIGPIFADETEALRYHSEIFQVPVVSFSRLEGIAATSPYFFRAYVSPSLIVDSLVKWVMKEYKLTKFAILFPRDGYGRFMMNLFWDTVESYGGKIVMAKSYDPSKTDIIDDIKKMVGTYYMDVFEKEAEERGEKLPPDFEPQPHVDFEALFLPESAMKGAFIARELAFADVMGVQLIGPDLWNDTQLIKIGENFVEGSIFADAFSPDAVLPDVMEFVKDFYEEYIMKPDTLSAFAYSISSFLIKLLDRKNPDGEDVRDDLLSSDIPFPGGILKFNRTGEVVHPVRIIAVEGQKFMVKY